MPLMCMCLLFDHLFGLVTTLTFDLLTSKSNWFIFVCKCTKVVNLVKFLSALL